MTTPTTVHYGVGVWHGALCELGKAHAHMGRLTFARERVTCAFCLVIWDQLEEQGWPVATARHWWEGYERQVDGQWCERLWRRDHKPSEARRRQAKRQGHRLERVRVVNARSLAYHAEKFTGGSHPTTEEVA